ncbi:MAG: hypothetical protein Q9201_001673 [Fulgogasparrea decipioides]
MAPHQEDLLSDGTPNQPVDGARNVPERLPGIYSRPQYSDGTFFPENFLDHETVIGYPTDKQPGNAGIDNILELISLLEHEGLRCCVLDVMALQYYGSRRMQNDWWICLSDTAVPQAEALIRNRPDKYIPFAPDCRFLDLQQSRWTRFKCVGLGLFFLLVPAREVCVDIEKEGSIVRGKTGLPFPSLPVFVQSLLDADNIGDLEDLVDAMDLPEEWAVANGVQLSETRYADSEVCPRSQWKWLTRTKQKRMGLKYNPKVYATKYRKHKSRDPGLTGWL